MVVVGVVPEVVVVAISRHRVDAGQQVVDGDIGDEGIDIEPILQFGLEVRIAGGIDEFDEVDQRFQVGLIGGGLLGEGPFIGSGSWPR